ncbi:hypothetical protein [Lacihabitans soyangensis]|uniref:Uncharacterized protein n=1 Tax=Lacihabitans soyangensis TaxID=869394 RepID=A0AAE3KRQ0_9BACT|nr:hypothetical protein [Lacihabitans soyangensis]MCP9762442.1 hypothetical protein [Lacihabitans soyangensis]
MAKFVIHKKGFFYTDESWEDVNANGTVVSIFNTLEEAKAEKINQDIISMQNLKGWDARDFFFYDNNFDTKNYDEKFEQMENYYKTEFDLTITKKNSFNFPNEINSEQAKVFLNILGFSFHDIVEYCDEEAPSPKNQDDAEMSSVEDERDYEEDELQEF